MIHNLDTFSGNKEQDNSTEKADSLSKKQEKYFLEKRVVYLADEVSEKTAKIIVEKLLLLDFDKPKTPIYFYINSPGGNVSDGMAIYDIMQLISSPVHTVCIGLAASMGSLLLSGGLKKHRYILPNAQVMIHQPLLSGRMQAVSTDLEIEALQMEKIKEVLSSLLSKNTGQTNAKIMKDIDRNYWMSATESLAYGIVDTVVSSIEDIK